MGLLDRLPGQGRRGVVVAIATGVAALLIASWLAWTTWGGEDGASPSVEGKDPSQTVVRVVSKEGGFSVDAPGDLTGKQIGPHVRLTSTDKSMVITVGPGPQGSAQQARKAAVADIRGNYAQVKVERTVDASLAGEPATRSIGVLRHKSGQQLIFSVTSTARGNRTWSVVMFADREIDAAQLQRWYEPVLEGFSILG